MTSLERDPDFPSDLVVGFSGAERNACVAVCGPERVLSVCEQERVTRVRAAGFNPTGFPDEALDELLRRAGRSRGHVRTYVTPERSDGAASPCATLDHHFAHACAAFLPTSFESAAILICDHRSPQVSVWEGIGSSIDRVDWPWNGPGFGELYSQCAAALGFEAHGKEQRFEALARLKPLSRSAEATDLLAGEPDRLRLVPDWQSRVEAMFRATGSRQERAGVAAAMQTRIGDLLVGLVGEIRRRVPEQTRLCVGGSLFCNSYLNSRVRQCGEFDEVFVPINPGNAGQSVGAALHACQDRRRTVSPFLGPAYSDEEIKVTLDNCKLTYRWLSEADIVAVAVDALRKGRLVAWFDGPSEWGPRALGNRSIVASPFAPYVLENLNTFLKQREPWRGYALSGTDAAVREHFEGPQTSPFMECDYVPRDRARFKEVLPAPDAAVRVHTVTTDASPKFSALLDAFGTASGASVLVNTSFNGFREPIVCSPRDAIRVFFGSGLDLLVLGHFVIAK